MAKKGMKRPQPQHRKNDLPPVPESGSDLARENLQEDWDMTRADLQDFWRKW